MAEEEDELMSTSQAAEYLGITRQHMHSLTKQGLGKQYGKLWMFRKRELDAWSARPHKGPGGRPKPETATMTPVVAV